ncbi:hypothetical protein AVEN_28704-1 [Araneus ventricosus]|uniref:RNase H type-1 domain-containing protein n=1 Tax=Araneus ventricosus TaxID=182803 RepID=A0A4Y2J453_ARAVE|nr:hypothetical protein AVEN_28704-1 [Araneus ventricosus]
MYGLLLPLAHKHVGDQGHQGLSEVEESHQGYPQPHAHVAADRQPSTDAFYSKQDEEPGMPCRNIQQSLFQQHNIKLGWIKAHAGRMGKEKADELAKEAISLQNQKTSEFYSPKAGPRKD